jgi:CheY-like chemotaxis protein
LALYRAEFLRDRGFEVTAPTEKEDAIATIRGGNFDVAVLSYTLSTGTVLELAEEIRETCPECPVIAIASSNVFDRRIAPTEVVLADAGPPALLAALQRVLHHT